MDFGVHCCLLINDFVLGLLVVFALICFSLRCCWLVWLKMKSSGPSSAIGFASLLSPIQMFSIFLPGQHNGDLFCHILF